MLSVSFALGPNTETIAQCTNDGTETVHLLYWGTPFDPVDRSLLKLTDDDGLEVKYRGPHAKRIFDHEASLLTLEPNDTISSTFDLAELFDLPYQGAFTVSLSEDSLLGFSGPRLREENLAPLQNEANSLRLEISPKPFEGIEDFSPLNYDFDDKVGSLSGPKCPPLFFCLSPAYHDGGVCHFNRYISFTRIVSSAPSKIKILQDQAIEAYKRILLFKVRDTPAFRSWFGSFDRRKANQVASVIRGFKGQLRCKSHVFYTDLGRCEDDTIAWYIKHPDPKQLSAANYCPRFFSLPDNGTDSKWGTILHELSHGYGGTVDHAYGQARCRQLAISAPHLAVENADSYQYYLEEEA